MIFGFYPNRKQQMDSYYWIETNRKRDDDTEKRHYEEIDTTQDKQTNLLERNYINKRISDRTQPNDERARKSYEWTWTGKWEQPTTVHIVADIHIHSDL